MDKVGKQKEGEGLPFNPIECCFIEPPLDDAFAGRNLKKRVQVRLDLG